MLFSKEILTTYVNNNQLKPLQESNAPLKITPTTLLEAFQNDILQAKLKSEANPFLWTTVTMEDEKTRTSFLHRKDPIRLYYKKKKILGIMKERGTSTHKRLLKNELLAQKQAILEGNSFYKPLKQINVEKPISNIESNYIQTQIGEALSESRLSDNAKIIAHKNKDLDDKFLSDFPNFKKTIDILNKDHVKRKHDILNKYFAFDPLSDPLIRAHKINLRKLAMEYFEKAVLRKPVLVDVVEENRLRKQRLSYLEDTYDNSKRYSEIAYRHTPNKSRFYSYLRNALFFSHAADDESALEENFQIDDTYALFVAYFLETVADDALFNTKSFALQETSTGNATTLFTNIMDLNLNQTSELSIFTLETFPELENAFLKDNLKGNLKSFELEILEMFVNMYTLKYKEKIANDSKEAYLDKELLAKALLEYYSKEERESSIYYHANKDNLTRDRRNYLDLLLLSDYTEIEFKYKDLLLSSESQLPFQEKAFFSLLNSSQLTSNTTITNGNTAILLDSDTSKMIKNEGIYLSSLKKNIRSHDNTIYTDTITALTSIFANDLTNKKNNTLSLVRHHIPFREYYKHSELPSAFFARRDKLNRRFFSKRIRRLFKPKKKDLNTKKVKKYMKRLHRYSQKKNRVWHSYAGETLYKEPVVEEQKDFLHIFNPSYYTEIKSNKANKGLTYMEQLESTSNLDKSRDAFSYLHDRRSSPTENFKVTKRRLKRLLRLKKKKKRVRKAKKKGLKRKRLLSALPEEFLDSYQFMDKKNIRKLRRTFKDKNYPRFLSASKKARFLKERILEETLPLNSQQVENYSLSNDINPLRNIKKDFLSRNYKRIRRKNLSTYEAYSYAMPLKASNNIYQNLYDAGKTNYTINFEESVNNIFKKNTILPLYEKGYRKPLKRMLKKTKLEVNHSLPRSLRVLYGRHKKRGYKELTPRRRSEIRSYLEDLQENGFLPLLKGVSRRKSRRKKRRIYRALHNKLLRLESPLHEPKEIAAYSNTFVSDKKFAEVSTSKGVNDFLDNRLIDIVTTPKHPNYMLKQKKATFRGVRTRANKGDLFFETINNTQRATKRYPKNKRLSRLLSPDSQISFDVPLFHEVLENLSEEDRFLLQRILFSTNQANINNKQRPIINYILDELEKTKIINAWDTYNTSINKINILDPAEDVLTDEMNALLLSYKKQGNPFSYKNNFFHKEQLTRTQKAPFGFSEPYKENLTEDLFSTYFERQYTEDVALTKGFNTQSIRKFKKQSKAIKLYERHKPLKEGDLYTDSDKYLSSAVANLITARNTKVALPREQPDIAKFLPRKYKKRISLFNDLMMRKPRRSLLTPKIRVNYFAVEKSLKAYPDMKNPNIFFSDSDKFFLKKGLLLKAKAFENLEDPHVFSNRLLYLTNLPYKKPVFYETLRKPSKAVASFEEEPLLLYEIMPENLLVAASSSYSSLLGNLYEEDQFFPMGSFLESPLAEDGEFVSFSKYATHVKKKTLKHYLNKDLRLKNNPRKRDNNILESTFFNAKRANDFFADTRKEFFKERTPKRRKTRVNAFKQKRQLESRLAHWLLENDLANFDVFDNKYACLSKRQTPALDVRNTLKEAHFLDFTNKVVTFDNTYEQNYNDYSNLLDDVKKQTLRIKKIFIRRLKRGLRKKKKKKKLQDTTLSDFLLGDNAKKKLVAKKIARTSFAKKVLKEDNVVLEASAVSEASAASEELPLTSFLESIFKRKHINKGSVDLEVLTRARMLKEVSPLTYLRRFFRKPKAYDVLYKVNKNKVNARFKKFFSLKALVNGDVFFYKKVFFISS